MNFPSIRLEGSILTADVLDAISREDKYSQKPADFGLPPSGKVKDEIASTWASAKALWSGYRSKIAALREGQTGVTETRNLFILPLLSMLGYQPDKAEAEVIGGKTYAISHRDSSRDGFPLHIMGWHDELNHKRVTGGPRLSPHPLVQEYLNLSEHLYALITNGRQLRLLRDSSRLIKLTFMEFDLVRIFDEDLYADFAILFRVLHATRMPANRASASASVIEKYHQDSVDSGSRIRDGLADAVAFAMQTVANGLLSHPENTALIAELRSDPARANELHQNLLRWVYRTLFVLVIEERGLNHAPAATLRQRQLYRDYYSLQRLRRLADRPQLADRRAHDLWRAMHQTLRLYEDGGKGLPLGIPPLGSFLFREAGLHALFQYQLDNRSLLLALHRLSTFTHPDTQVRMRVNYGALDVEEFGSVYESLLELRPRIIPDGEKLTFSYAQLAGNERKTTGSYYTPDSLVQCLMDSALDPVVEERLKGKTGPAAEEALLSIKVCDPAVGSGHFLIGAAHRLAQRLAEIRAGEEALSPDVQRHALRDVVSRCLYGVDVNPLSVELCKVSLWMLALEPGKPLGFLDHHIQCGNSLLGATPRVLADGLPDDAFKPIAGDDKAVCANAKKQNKLERKIEGHGELFDREERYRPLQELPAAMLALGTMSDDTADALHAKEQRYAELIRSTGYLSSRFLADAWCAAFVWKKTRDLPYPITNDVLRKIERNPHDCAPWMREEIERLRDRYQFFHWHLAFPEVFPVPVNGERPANKNAGWNGGFDVMLGNPPWERIQLEANQFFASRRPELLEMKRSERERAIEGLAETSPALFSEWQDQRRLELSTTAFLKDSGLYSLSTQKNVNSYAVFSELAFTLVGQVGRCGMITQSGIATDDIMKPLFQFLMESQRLVSLFDFENREKLFPAVHPQLKFCLITVSGPAQRHEIADFVFYATRCEHLAEEDRHFLLTVADIALLNPNTRTCPIFRSKHAAELCLSIYRKVAVLCREVPPCLNPWNASIRRMFDMSYDSHLFRTRLQLIEAKSPEDDESMAVLPDGEYLRLYESKLMHQFDHRFASFRDTVGEDDCDDFSNERKRDPSASVLTRYWVRPKDYAEKMSATGWTRKWISAFRMITNTTNERTAISAILPLSGVGNSSYTLTFDAVSPDKIACFVANANSFCLDWLTRQKLAGSNLNVFILKQLPLLTPETYAEPCAWAGQPAVTHCDWLLPRVLELTYTAWDLEPFARDCGWFGPPFVWDEARRFQLRCELDAAFLHLYGLSRADAAYILDTFPIVRRKDEAAHGTYRTRDTILALYDQFAEASTSGNAFISPLDPPPGDIRACHPPKKQN